MPRPEISLDGAVTCYDCRVGGCRHRDKILDRRGVLVCARPRPADTAHGNPLCEDCAAQVDVRHMALRHGGVTGHDLRLMAAARRRARWRWLFGEAA